MTTYLIKRARPLGGEAADILVADGRIASIGENLTVPGAEVIDAAGKTVLPGLWDMLRDGSPIRKTDRAGVGTKGTRAVEGVDGACWVAFR